jgi:hypothetical protein
VPALSNSCQIVLSSVTKPDSSTIVSWSLTVEGPSYGEGRVHVALDGRRLIEAAQPDFHAFVAATNGRPVRAWEEVGKSLGIVLQLPEQRSTVLDNLLKAGSLVYQWLEPAFVARNAESLEHELVDQIIIDHTGAPGRQPFLYFLSEFYGRASETERLFALQLLSRAIVSIGNSEIVRYFKPLAVPAVMIAKFDRSRPDGGDAYALWQAIRKRMTAAIERVVDS